MNSAVRTLCVPLDVTIANGESLSDAVSLAGHTLSGIIMPASWTAADLTFQVCATEGGTFVDLYDEDDAELVVSAAASRGISVEPINFIPWNFIKVRSGTTGTPVSQGAERTLTLMIGYDR